MKRLLTLILSATLTMMNMYSQTAPLGINYQAVARDNAGIELTNQSLDVRFSILQNSPGGALEWQETQTAQTNQFGLFTLTIGQINNKTGGTALNFDSVKWGSGSHYLKTEIDFGSGFVTMGTTQMQAVPYALYAKTAGSGGGSTAQITYNPTTRKLYVNSNEVADLSGIGANAVQNLALNTSDQLVYQQNGQPYTINLDKYIDHLSISGKVLSLSNGSSVNLPDYQDLFEDHDSIYLTLKTQPRKIDLSQKLTVDKKNNTLTIKRGNTVPIDADTTNEIQQLTYSGKYISLSKNGGSVYDADTSKTNELITATEFDGNNLKITEAGQIHTADLSILKNVPWEGFSYNNNSGVAISGLAESLIAWNKEFDDGNLIQSNALTSTVDGAVYSISLNLALTSTNAKVKFYKGSAEYKSFDAYNNAMSFSFLVKLNQGETISVKIQNTSSFAINLAYAIFSGYRVH